jgi:hypothetical protein
LALLASKTLADGSTLLDSNQILIHTVFTGDANMDGTVDFLDITQIYAYYYNTGHTARYTDGDLDYSKQVDFFDLTVLLADNYNTGVSFNGWNQPV